jgi:hypothetical protein
MSETDDATTEVQIEDIDDARVEDVREQVQKALDYKTRDDDGEIVYGDLKPLASETPGVSPVGKKTADLYDAILEAKVDEVLVNEALDADEQAEKIADEDEAENESDPEAEQADDSDDTDTEQTIEDAERALEGTDAENYEPTLLPDAFTMEWHAQAAREHGEALLNGGDYEHADAALDAINYKSIVKVGSVEQARTIADAFDVDAEGLYVEVPENGSATNIVRSLDRVRTAMLDLLAEIGEIEHGIEVEVVFAERFEYGYDADADELVKGDSVSMESMSHEYTCACGATFKYEGEALEHLHAMSDLDVDTE